jgi:hypothetical protein
MKLLLTISQSPVELGLCLRRGFLRASIFVAAAHPDDGKRFVVRADEKLTAFVELEWAIYRVRRYPA